jgi:nitrous oxide reductase accessory protein NosL
MHSRDSTDGDCSHHHSLGRRQVLLAGGVAVAAGLAGCSAGPSGDVPDPVALTSGQQCDVCGMVIQNHPGPDGQIFFRQNEPEGHAPPARFDSLKQCLFPYLFEREQRDWTPAAIYVTDYSSVEYTVQSEGDTTIVSSHPEAGAFADAEPLSYVVGSDVEGAMGPDFVPFSEESDATAFADEYGGDVVGFDDIDRTLVGR